MAKTTWLKVGTIRKPKSGKGSYLQLDEPVNLAKGARLQLQDPRVKLDESVEAGRITEAKAEEIRAKIPDYILREVYLVTE